MRARQMFVSHGVIPPRLPTPSHAATGGDHLLLTQLGVRLFDFEVRGTDEAPPSC